MTTTTLSSKERSERLHRELFPPQPKLSLHNQIIVGTLSGWTEICVCQPIDTYKTGLQSAKPVRFAEFFNKGVTHWYAGMTPMLVFRAVYISSLKVANESYKTFVSERGWDVTSRAQLMAGGAFAGVVATPVSCVSEWFKTQMQNNGLKLSVLLNENRRSFKAFAGISSTTLREGCYGATLFGLNPIYREKAAELLPDLPRGLTNLIAGALAGITGGVISQPFDTIKTLMQEKYGSNVKSSIYNTVKERIDKRGFLSLWAGGLPRASRLAIGTFILDRCIFYFTNLVNSDGTSFGLTATDKLQTSPVVAAAAVSTLVSVQTNASTAADPSAST